MFVVLFLSVVVSFIYSFNETMDISQGDKTVISYFARRKVVKNQSGFVNSNVWYVCEDTYHFSSPPTVKRHKKKKNFQNQFV